MSGSCPRPNARCLPTANKELFLFLDSQTILRTKTRLIIPLANTSTISPVIVPKGISVPSEGSRLSRRSVAKSVIRNERLGLPLNISAICSAAVFAVNQPLCKVPPHAYSRYPGHRRTCQGPFVP
jgi:hypothetical protein